MLSKEVKDQIIELAPHHTQQAIADKLGVSRSSVGRFVLLHDIRTGGRNGRKRKPAGITQCGMCGTDVVLKGAHLRSLQEGRKVCCSKECRDQRAREWALAYDGYKSGPEANRWKHGLCSNVSREASITIAAINRLIRKGVNQ